MLVAASVQLGVSWASRGFPVFPIAIGWDAEKGHTSKRPLTLRGHADGTTNLQEIKEMFEHLPLKLAAGEVLAVGMHPGDAGYIILDADRHKYDGVFFADSIGAVTPYVVDTASDGEHRFFKKPAGMTFSNRTPVEWRGLVDVRGDSGWIVAPGVVTEWGSWEPRTDWGVAIPELPKDIAAQLQGLATDGEGVTQGRYVPEKHDKFLHPHTLAAYRILVEKHGANARYTQFAHEVFTDGVTGVSETKYWLKVVRPGKSAGVSGTVGFVGDGVFYCFTSEWDPFEQSKAYDFESFEQHERTEQTGQSGRIKVRRGTDFKMEHVRWAWEDRLAVGMLSLLAGREGLGKSMIGYWLASQITLGKLPGAFFGEAKDVLLVATEDSWQHVVIPRLTAAGADLSRICQIKIDLGDDIEGEVVLPKDIQGLRELALELRPGLLLLDPFMSRVASGLDSHKDAEVRRALEPLTNMLVETEMSALGIMHFNKAGGTDALNSIMASKAFTAVARTVNVVLPHPITEGDGLFATAKSNIGPSISLPRLGYRVEQVAVHQGGEVFSTGTVRWTEQYQGSLDDAMEAAQNGGDKGPGVEAREFLSDYLTDNAGPNGWVPRKEIMAAARREEINKAAIERARVALNVQRRRTKMNPPTAEWRLPVFDVLDGLVEE